MSKRIEYNIKFYWSYIAERYIFDANDAVGVYSDLSFINHLYKEDIIELISVIHEIQQGEIYDPDFLTSSEIYQIFNVQFSNPNFFVEGVNIINMDDLKMLLEEWIELINS